MRRKVGPSTWAELGPGSAVAPSQRLQGTSLAEATPSLSNHRLFTVRQWQRKRALAAGLDMGSAETAAGAP